MAWWRDGLTEIHTGALARAHPALQAYAAHAHALPGEAWSELIEAEAAFALGDEAESAVRAASAVLRLASHGCGGEAGEMLLQRGATAWGLLRLMRSRAAHGAAAHALSHLVAAYREAREVGRMAPAQLFPAMGYLALTPLYVSALKAGRRQPPLLLRQLRLVAASATGRL